MDRYVFLMVVCLSKDTELAKLLIGAGKQRDIEGGRETSRSPWPKAV
jgi:hypothetical protein